MSDILPKPFTKDSLLGMLEKHLTHMRQMQELGGSVIPAPMKNDRPVELPEPIATTAPRQHDSSLPLGLALDEEAPFQLSYDQDYSIIFGSSATSVQQQSMPTSMGKRRTASERDPYESLEQGRSMPRSVGGDAAAPTKRARYNTPPW